MDGVLDSERSERMYNFTMMCVCYFFVFVYFVAIQKRMILSRYFKFLPYVKITISQYI